MSASFSTTTPSEQSELYRFLDSVFAMGDPPPNYSAAAMAWKYFDPHPLWPESRSYTLRTEAGIAAHGCVSPVRYASSTGGFVESLQVIDWAAGRLIPGAGLLVYRKCLELNKGTLLAIGGSEDTSKIIPQVKWFQAKDDMRTFARPLRPLRLWSKGGMNLRSTAKLGRNLRWTLSPALPPSGNWTCRPARPGDAVFTPETSAYIPIARSRAWLDYLLRCPVVPTQLVVLENSGKPAGHALLADALGSIRVADFVANGPAPESAFAALIRFVAEQPNAAEISAASSVAGTCAVFERCGLRYRASQAVFLADPRKQIPAGMPIEVTPMIGDAFYLTGSGYPFVC